MTDQQIATVAEGLTPCSAYQPGCMICRNGFPTGAICRGSTFYARLPHCLDDDYAPRQIIGDDGRPRYAVRQYLIEKGDK